MKVALVGDALTSRHAAPFDDPETEIWGLGNGWMHLRRVDRYFELHDEETVRADSVLDNYYPAPARLGAKEVIAHQSIPDLWETVNDKPVVQIFPFEDIIDWAPRPYFTSSFAWIIAYAMWRFGPKLEEISLFGIDMSNGVEYRLQRACFEFWLGFAMGKGIRIGMPEDCPLLQTAFLYAYQEEANERVVKIIDHEKEAQDADIAKWVARHTEAKEVWRQAKARMHEITEAKEKGVITDPAWLDERLLFLAQEIKRAEANEAEALVGVGQFASRKDALEVVKLNYTYPVNDPDAMPVPLI